MAFNPASARIRSLSAQFLRALSDTSGLGVQGPPIYQAVSELSRLFTVDRGDLPRNYLEERGLCIAYESYYLPVNAAKVQSLLDELPADVWEREPLSRALSVLDVGSGPGTASIALLDWINHRLPSHSLTIKALAVDQSAVALRSCQRLWDVYQQGPSSPFSALDVSQVNIEQLAKSRSLSAIVRHSPFDLIVCANSLNELFRTTGDPIEARASLVQFLLSLLREDGTLMILEPALRPIARDLHRLRDQLLAKKACTVYSPCLHDNSCPALVKEDDWCHEERPWVAPSVIQAIDREVGFIKDALKFSYLLLRKDGRSLASREPTVFRVVSELREMKGEKRAWLCNETGRPEVGRLDRVRSEANASLDDWRRGAIVKIEEIVRKERHGKQSSLGRIPATAKVEVVRPV